MSIDELEVNIEWWIGGWTKTWNQWKTKGQVNTATVHKNAIIMAPFAFTKSNRLPREVCDKLRMTLNSCESVQHVHIYLFLYLARFNCCVISFPIFLSIIT